MATLAGFQYTPENVQKLEKVGLAILYKYDGEVQVSIMSQITGKQAKIIEVQVAFKFPTLFPFTCNWHKINVLYMYMYMYMYALIHSLFLVL